MLYRTTSLVGCCRQRVEDSHSYLAATDQGGLSGRLGSLVLTEADTTLRQLRVRIQEFSEGMMIKRTPMYEEILFVMSRCPNRHGWPEDRRFEYRLGLAEENEEVPRLVSQEDEETKSIYDVMNPVLEDLVVVPLTQINQEGRLVP